MADPLASVFSRSALMALADPVSLLRGATYADEGRVEQAADSGSRLEATVRGSLPYAVALWVDGNEPAWSCTCPAAEDGTFCKHCVALALYRQPELIEQALDPEEEWEDGVVAASPGDEATLRGYVSGLDAGRLAELLLEQAAGDWRLRERLLAEAAAAAGSTIDIAAWRCRLDAAFAAGDFVEYAEAASWARDVQEALNALAELVEVGHAGAVVVLAEHAWRLAEDTVDYVDDSGGWLGEISSQLGDLHHRACVEAKADPVALARRLVELELSSELDAFYRAAARYADVLGDAGLAEYRRLIEPHFDALGTGGGHSLGDFRVTQAMVGVALASGDPDQLIAAKGRDLRAPDDYREIASMLAEAGRVPEAIDWAQRGLAAFPDQSWQIPQLRELLAGFYRRQGQPDAAINVFWDGFQAAPSLQRYRRLLQEAGAAEDAYGWRERALEHLRDRLKIAAANGRPAPLGSTVVEILLYEGQVDEAWEVASTHGCASLALARAREATHPEDAIGVYAREAADLISATQSKLYPRAVDLMARIERCYSALERPEGFATYIAQVRAEHGRKRSLMALLNGKRW